MSAATADTHRAVAWVKDDPFGVEFAETGIARTRLNAAGVAIGTAPLPYRLDYELETGAGFVTARLNVTSRGAGWHRELELRRGGDGVWDIAVGSSGDVDLPPAGGEAAPLGQALDCDLELSPVTNTMPILRHRLLHGGGPVELTMAWVAVPHSPWGPIASATATSRREPCASRRSTTASSPTSPSTPTPS